MLQQLEIQIDCIQVQNDDIWGSQTHSTVSADCTAILLLLLHGHSMAILMPFSCHYLAACTAIQLSFY